MSDLLRAKVAAYLLDRVILLNPIEVSKSLNEKPKFAGGANIRELSFWSDNDLVFLSKLFWDDTFHKPVGDGFKGAGIDKNRYGQYRIVLHGDVETCKLLNSKIPFLKNKCPFDVCCNVIEKIEFASNGSSNSACLGGECILIPSGKGIGTFGAWLRRGNDRRRVVGITNNHVASEFNKNPKGTRIYNHSNCQIGEIERFIPLLPYDPMTKDRNLVDLALIRPLSQNIVDHSLLCTQYCPKGECFLQNNWQKGKNDVILCTKKAPQISGAILGILSTFYIVHYNVKYSFEDVIRIDIGSAGNSGALVMDHSHYIGGIFFAFESYGGRSSGFVNKWEYVKSESGVDFLL